MPVWTLEYNGLAQNLAKWGLAEPQLNFYNQAADTLTVVAAGRAYDDAPLFAFLAEVILRRDATVVFRGRCMTADVSGESKGEEQVYQFAGPWSYFERITFHQRWKNFGTTPASFAATSHVRVPARFDGNNHLEYITTGQQIEEVISFVRTVAGNVVQAGSIIPALQIPMDEKVDRKCHEIVQMMLALTPDAVVYFDYTFTPPKLHVIQRAQRVSKTLALSAKRIRSLRLRRRHDLVPSAVVVNYERTDTLDGTPLPFYSRDAYPAGNDGTSENCLTTTVKLFGAEVVHVRGYLETLPIPINPDANWFIARGLPVESNGVISQFQYLSGEEPGLAHEIVDGNWQRWFDGGDSEAQQETFKCVYTYEIPGKKKDKAKPGQVRINTTSIDATDGRDFKAISNSTSAEPTPVGMAEYVARSLGRIDANTEIPPYEGTVTLSEEEALIDLGLQHTLNISGGTNRYAAMEALVQSVSVDLESGRTTIQLGPPKHLGVPDLLEMLRFNRRRRVYTNALVQEGGNMGGTDVNFDGKPAAASGSTNTGQGVNGKWIDGTGPYVQIGETIAPPSESSPGSLGSPKLIKIASTTSAGSITLSLADILNKEIQFREMPFSEKQADGSCKNRKIIVLSSAVYD
jgi:hypothetical protein